MSYQELVLNRGSGRGGTLDDTTRSIHLRGLQLVDTVPVKTSCLVAKTIVEIHNEGIANSRFELGAWPLVVDTNDRSTKTIGRSPNPCDVPVDGDNCCPGNCAKAQQCQGKEG